MFPVKKYITHLSDACRTVTAHWHEEAEFTLVKEGHGTYQIQLEAYEVSAGDLLFIPPAVLHSITVPPCAVLRTETYVFHMHFLGTGSADVCAVRYLMPLTAQKLHPPVLFYGNSTRQSPAFSPEALSAHDTGTTMPPHPLHAPLATLFSDIDQTYTAAAPGYELLLKADFLKLTALLIPFCSETPSGLSLHEEHSAKLKTVLDYISHHYAEDLSVAGLAELCYFSEYHFMRFFKKYIGMSCLEYIKSLRLEKAAELFAQGNTSTLEVSLSVGFRNLSYFHREFKKKYGVTPKKFRMSL